MKSPSLRNPEGFGDIFPILAGCIVLLGIFIQLSDDIIFRRVYLLGAIVAFGWVSWALFSILSISSEEEDN